MGQQQAQVERGAEQVELGRALEFSTQPRAARRASSARSSSSRRNRVLLPQPGGPSKTSAVASVSFSTSRRSSNGSGRDWACQRAPWASGPWSSNRVRRVKRLSRSKRGWDHSATRARRYSSTVAGAWRRRTCRVSSSSSGTAPPAARRRVRNSLRGSGFPEAAAERGAAFPCRSPVGGRGSGTSSIATRQIFSSSSNAASASSRKSTCL